MDLSKWAGNHRKSMEVIGNRRKTFEAAAVERRVEWSGVKNHRATHTKIPTCSARREQCDGTHALAPPRPHNARRLIHALRFFRHAIMRTPCTTAHGIAGQHVGGRGRSRVRSNGAEPYLIACGVHGGAGGATAEVGGENCARGATAEGRVGGRQQRTAWRHVGGRASSRARSNGNQP